MMHYTHSPGGIFATALYFTFVPPTDLVALGVGLVAGGIGGLLPDIDHSGSKISKQAGVVGTVISKLLTHRGIAHTPILWCLIFGGLYYWLPDYHYIFLPMWLGTLSHLFLDSLTPKGVPLLAPLYREKINFLKIKTGGFLESVCSGLLQIGSLYLVLQLVHGGL